MVPGACRRLECLRINKGLRTGGLRQKGSAHSSLTKAHTGCVSQKVEMVCRVREVQFFLRARGVVSGMNWTFKS